MLRRAWVLLAGMIAAGTIAGPSNPASAEPIGLDQIPDALAPWIGWATYGQEARLCPAFVGAAPDAPRLCAWPSRLELDVDSSEGAFVQDWRAWRAEFVPLPGDAKTWPLDVRADGEPVAVVESAGRPAVRLGPGSHRIEGRFEWPAPPSTVAIPRETGLVALTLLGRAVPVPDRDAAGRLWVTRRAAETRESAEIEVAVWRRIAAEVPMRVETRLELKVSGPSREETLAAPLPPDFVPLELRSDLPAKIEPDGRLLVQVRPGRHVLTVIGRSTASVASLAFAPPEGRWAEREVWAFDARPALRLVQIEGVAAVDPGQTRLPDEWAGMPVYVLKPGDAMTFVEKRRGDVLGADDPLALERAWWLDFDGTGYTVEDTITGALRGPQRLEMAAGTDLGRVAVGGRDQFITRWGESGRLGVELRGGALHLSAASRTEGDPRRTPAVGWDRDFREVGGTLHLPPGWRLALARGVDAADPTWIRDWSLLDLFGALVTTVAVFQLWGVLWGLVAAGVVALTWTEPGAPSWIWLAFFAGEALVRAVRPKGEEGAPPGGARRWLRFYRLAALVAVGLTAVPFVIREIRVGMYPALEYGFWAVGAGEPEAVGAAAPMAPAESMVAEEKASGAYDRSAASRPRRYFEEPDPNARVQTGPGVPAWRWNQVRLAWRGPVDRDQAIELFLLPPRVNLGLAVARSVLLGLLLLGVSGAFGLLGGRRAAAAAAVALGCAIAPASPARADIPPKELLEELRERLLAAPDCAPQCAAADRMLLAAVPEALRIRFDVGAADLVAVPLPGSLDQWSPERVLVDGEPAEALSRSQDGRLWIVLAEGPHQIVLEGPLPARDSVQIQLPLRPKRLEAALRGWTLAGLRDDGTPEDNLQLSRDAGPAEGPKRELEPTALPPFVTVERSVLLGVDWRVRTLVRRETPRGSAIVLDVPLLPGESVLTPGVEVRDGRALVTLGPQVSAAGWESSLAPGPRLDLVAAGAGAIGEHWRLQAASIWHLAFEGIAPVHADEAGASGGLEWRPWPGERVEVRVDRPAGAGGPTLTVDAASLEVRPGLRAVDGALAVRIRSSRGAQHPIRLPEGADLESVTLGGERQPVEAIDGVVTVSVAPGVNDVRVSWRTPGGIARRFETPRVDLGAPAANFEIRVEMPRDRWILFVGGPRVGPAVLFWSFLAVLAPIAWVLGRIRWTPLRARHWFGLGIGLSQVSVVVAAVVAGWLVALGWRRERPEWGDRGAFNLRQALLVLWTAAALAGLVWGIEQGLLGLPEMQIAGNGSNAGLLRWYVDRAAAEVPTAWAVSAPLWAYRVAMLLWALWIAWALIRWLRWGWEAFGTGGAWKPRGPKSGAPVRGLRVPEGPPAGEGS